MSLEAVFSLKFLVFLALEKHKFPNFIDLDTEACVKTTFGRRNCFPFQNHHLFVQMFYAKLYAQKVVKL